MTENENPKKEKVEEQKSTDANNNVANDNTSATKNNLNDAAKKAGELAGKAFAMGKAATKDIAQELKNVNEIRKETVATAELGTAKKDLAKSFWAKLSGKQKSILFVLVALLTYTSYSLVFSSYQQKNKTGKIGTPPAQNANNQNKEVSNAQKQGMCYATLLMQNPMPQGEAERRGRHKNYHSKFEKEFNTCVRKGIDINDTKSVRKCLTSQGLASDNIDYMEGFLYMFREIQNNNYSNFQINELAFLNCVSFN